MTREFYLLRFDDNKGNLGRKSSAMSFFRGNGFICKAGFWGCPWYFVDIKNKIYYPGRPGLAYGKVIKEINFEDLKKLTYSN